MLIYASIEGYKQFIEANYNIKDDNCNDTDVAKALLYAETKVLSWINSCYCCCDISIGVDNANEIISNAIYILAFDYTNIEYDTSDQNPTTSHESTSFLYLKKNHLIWA